MQDDLIITFRWSGNKYFITHCAFREKKGKVVQIAKNH